MTNNPITFGKIKWPDAVKAPQSKVVSAPSNEPTEEFKGSFNLDLRGSRLDSEAGAFIKGSEDVTGKSNLDVRSNHQSGDVKPREDQAGLHRSGSYTGPLTMQEGYHHTISEPFFQALSQEPIDKSLHKKILTLDNQPGPASTLEAEWILGGSNTGVINHEAAHRFLEANTRPSGSGLGSPIGTNLNAHYGVDDSTGVINHEAAHRFLDANEMSGH
jgi:hypothetical protein